ncbi:MAG: TSUP family transporter [Candidatus Accumulibacter sp.]|uniref:Probable membrane transporter protein n=1 Tax=Candidatus Accumulibacter affinis TaxID=2954384 RepID=A0A935T8N1_9PROT|nr:TSUP family transporter [Candidatus Accumulibacter affinis]
MVPGLDFSVLLTLAVAALLPVLSIVVGGGGLIQIPALFNALPRELPATIFGTNKFSERFWHRQRGLALRASRQNALANDAAGGSWRPLSARIWAQWPSPGCHPALLRPLILLLLIGAAAYTFMRSDFGAIHQPLHKGRREFAYALLLGGAIGFYDGFFGPGTGSFLIFLFIRFFGFDFLHASAASKLSMCHQPGCAWLLCPTWSPSATACGADGRLQRPWFLLRHTSGSAAWQWFRQDRFLMRGWRLYSQICLRYLRLELSRGAAARHPGAA